MEYNGIRCETIGSDGVHQDQMGYDGIRSNHFTNLPLVKTSSTKKSIKFEGPKFWNSLGQSLREVSSLSKFKTKLKQFIFEKYQCL